MSTCHATLLAALAAVWGGSYLLIKYALDGFSAATIVSARSLIASAVLFAVLKSRGLAPATLRDVRERPKWALILALTAVAAPFLLITFGEHVVPSGLTAVLISPASLFVALLAPFILPSESITAARARACCSAWRASRSSSASSPSPRSSQFLGALAMIGAAFFYGLSGFVVKGRYGRSPRSRRSWISVTIAGLITLPAGIATTPGHTPALGAIAAVVVLGAVGTAIAFVIYYELIAGIGPARAALVSYLAPGIALFYGAIFLDETITVAAIAGLVLILGGVAIASRPKRVPVKVAQPAAASA